MLFFFQADDGIRVTSVTGVQTCALPISMNIFKTAFLSFSLLFMGNVFAQDKNIVETAISSKDHTTLEDRKSVV